MSDCHAITPDMEELLVLCDTLADELGRQRDDIDLQRTGLREMIEAVDRQAESIMTFSDALMKIRRQVEDGIIPAHVGLARLSLETELLPRRFNSSEFASAISLSGRRRSA